MIFEKKILVLGACGFIGNHLSEFLSIKGYSIVGIGHPKNNMDLPGYFFESEITEEAILKYCPDPDVIINCAGGASVPASFAEPFHDFQRTTHSLFAGLEFIRKFKPECLFIQTSSAAVYGSQQGKLSENAITEEQISPYGVYKKICEQICMMYYKQFGINISILRLFSVYGLGLKKQLLWDACNKINNGNNIFFGTGKEIRDWVHINDICKLFEIIIDLNQLGMFFINGGSGVGTCVSQIVEIIYKGLSAKSRPQFSQICRQGDPDVFIADNILASSIGWQVEITPEIGIQEYIEWFKKNHLK